MNGCSEGDCSNCEIHYCVDAGMAMYDHSSAAYPFEGCGVFVGKKMDNGAIEIVRTIATRNSAQSRKDQFTIDPHDLLTIERELDKRCDGSRIVGFFHSHPDSRALPSSTDLEMAQGLFDVTREFYIYAIVGVDKGVAGEITFWRLSENALQFTNVTSTLLDY